MVTGILLVRPRVRVGTLVLLASFIGWLAVDPGRLDVAIAPGGSPETATTGRATRGSAHSGSAEATLLACVLTARQRHPQQEL